jgi:DNA-binding MarR family transcriptional regulator
VSHASREANLLGAAALAVAGRLDATPADAALLALSGWLAGATIDDLAHVVALSHSGAVRLADRLQQDGLLARAAGRDGRSVALQLTPAGLEAAADLRAARERTMAEALELIEPSRRTAFVAALEDLLGGLVHDHADARRVCRLCDADACGHPDRCPVTLAAR